MLTARNARGRRTAVAAWLLTFAVASTLVASAHPSEGSADPGEGSAPGVAEQHHHAGPVDAEFHRDHPGHARVTVVVDPDRSSDPDPDSDQNRDPGPSPEGKDLPNLVPWHPFHVSIDERDGPATVVDARLGDLRGRPRPTGPALRFSTTIENVGAHSYEIIGVPSAPDSASEHPEDATTVTALQCVRFGGPPAEGAERACLEHHEVGTLSYHAHHGHFHMDGFARYELRRDAAGEPMAGPGGVAATAEKAGFCVQDMWYARGEPSPQPWYRWCQGTPTVPYAFTQGISPGWTDTYFAYFPGQQIPLEGVPDGVYWLMLTVNPPGDSAIGVLESDRSDNTSAARIRISGERTEVEVLEERGRASPSSR